MSIRYAAIATVIIVLTLVASCGTAEPTGTPVPPTDTPVPDGLTIDVPRGNPPTLDGTLSSDEWSGAQKAELAGGGELLLVHDGSYLYLGHLATKRAGYGRATLGRIVDEAIAKERGIYLYALSTAESFYHTVGMKQTPAYVFYLPRGERLKPKATKMVDNEPANGAFARARADRPHGRAKAKKRENRE